MKFSPQGDSIWSRYDLAPFPPHYTNDHYFGGVGVLSSGNIIAGGSASKGNKQYIWLVKVTPDGCLDTLFCGLVGTGEAPRQAAEVQVYPNPATEKITVEMTKGFPAGQAILHDLGGRVVLQATLPVEQSQLRLPVYHLPPGIYFLALHVGDKTVVRRKVVIGR